MAERKMEVEQLKRMLENDLPVSVVDIREPDDYAPWHIHGSMNVPVYDALKQGDDAPLTAASRGLPQDRPVVTVCRGGVMSRRAASLLNELGFDAASLEGGMRRWTDVWSRAPVPIEHSGAEIVQVRRNGKGCLSYVVGRGGEAVVFDPCVSVEAYREVADRADRSIVRVVETHVHADHISRARSLAEAVGAELVMPRNDRVRFDYEPVDDGDRFALGDLEIGVLATPGHTSESVCYRIGDRALLSGDTLFTVAVGRPDLERGDAGAREGAEALHRSLGRLLSLPDETAFYPAHHADPIAFDGVPIGSTLGAARTWLASRLADRDRFVTAVVDGLGEKPGNHETMLEINEGRAELDASETTELEAGPNRCAVG